MAVSRLAWRLWLCVAWRNGWRNAMKSVAADTAVQLAVWRNSSYKSNMCQQASVMSAVAVCSILRRKYLKCKLANG